MASISSATFNPQFSAAHQLKDPVFFPQNGIKIPNHSPTPRVRRAMNTTATDGSDFLNSAERSNGEDQTRAGLNLEDRILEDTVPLAGFARMILHSGKYKCGDSLSPEHQRIILEKVLPYHPAYNLKIGCGVDHIMVGYHPEFEDTKCLFIVRKNGETVDFSYWKCIKGMIKKKYPSHAKKFIFRHLHRQKRNV